MAREEWSRQALDGLTGGRDAFWSTIADALAHAQALLDAAEPGNDAAARDAGATDVIARCAALLRELAAGGDAVFLARIEPGGDLSAAATRALARAGRAFAAMRVIELARTRRCRIEAEAGLLDDFPPDAWNAAERMVAPPLVVEVGGTDLRAGSLAHLLDGAQKLVLVVGSPAPAAPLVRLISPGVLVAQTADAGDLAALLSFPGPAIVALMPESAASFVHDPRGGDSLRERLGVARLPRSEPRGPLGQATAFQRAEELRQLAALAEGVGFAVAAASATAPAAAVFTSPATATEAAAAAQEAPVFDAAAPSVEQLTAWLLRQADFACP